MTVEGKGHRLPDPFLVIATQNPYEHRDVFELPESQLDRFLFKIELEYSDAESEYEMLDLPHKGVAPDMLGEVQPLLGVVGLDKARIELDSTELPEEVGRYMVAVARMTRSLAGRRARSQLTRDHALRQRLEGERAAQRTRLREGRGRARDRAVRPPTTGSCRGRREARRTRSRTAFEQVPVPETSADVRLRRSPRGRAASAASDSRLEFSSYARTPPRAHAVPRTPARCRRNSALAAWSDGGLVPSAMSAGGVADRDVPPAIASSAARRPERDRAHVREPDRGLPERAVRLSTIAATPTVAQS